MLENRRVLAAAMNLAAIEGTIFSDSNQNGIVDVGETIAGVQLELEDTFGNPIFQNGIPLVTSTDSQGIYEFRFLEAGQYVVHQPSQVVGGDQLPEKSSSTVTITSTDALGMLSTPIDTFDNSPQFAVDFIQDGIPVSSQLLTSDSVGGQRDLIVELLQSMGSMDDVSLTVDSGFSEDALQFDSSGGGSGSRRVIWDGVDSEATVLEVDDTGTTGIGNIDLTSGGDSTGVNLLMGVDQPNANIVLRVFSDDSSPNTANRYSQWTIDIPQYPVGTVDPLNEFVPFDDPSRLNFGGGADLTNVTAFEIEVIAGLTADGTVELLGAVGLNTLAGPNIDNFEEADLGITKTVNDPSPNLGEQITYTIGLTNNGPLAATNIVVTDQIPSGITFQSSSDPANYNPSTGIWNVASLAAGANRTLTITGIVNDVNVQINQATITSLDQTDPNPNNDSASVNVTPQAIDLRVDKTMSNLTPNVGETITFTVTVRNVAVQTATGVQLTDVLPTGIRYVTSNATGGGLYDPFSGIWNIGTLPGNGTDTLTIQAVVDTTGPRFNEAEITAADQTDVSSTPGDGMGVDYDRVDFTTPSANLSLTKTVNTTTPNWRSDVNFTIIVTNSGPDAATGVTVLDQIPVGMSFQSSSAGQDYSAVSGIWNIGRIESGATATLVIVASVDTIAAKTNTAQVQTSDVDDPNSDPGNNIPQEDDQESVTITPVAIDLSLNKTVNNGSPDVGDSIIFSITVTNSGPSNATGVVVRDQLPAGTQFVSATYGAGSGTGVPDYNVTTGVWNIGNVNIGSPVTLNLTALVVSAGITINSAEVIAADQPDTDSTPGNGDPTEDDQDDAQIRPKQIDLALTKTVSNFSPSVDDEINFVITVNNTGEDVATGVQVSEVLPTSVTFISGTPSRGSYDRNRGVWNIGTVGINDPVTLTLRTRVNSISMGSNTSQVIAADQQDVDSTPNNNIPTEDDQDSVSFTTESADLSLQKELVFGDERPNVGDEVVFRVSIQNDGPDDATTVQVTDLLPAGLQIINDTVSTGIYNRTSGVWTVGDLRVPTERQIISISPELGTASSGTLLFTQQSSPASYTSQVLQFQTDPLGETSNALSALGYVTSQFQLRQISVPNNPNGTNIEIRFVGEALYQVDIPQINLTPNLDVQVITLTTEINAFDVNLFETLELRAEVVSAVEIVNIAEVTNSDQSDPDSTPGDGDPNQDDYDSVTLLPQLIDLELDKTASMERPNPGDEIIFTLSLINQGPDPATGVEVTDLLPPELTYQSSQPAGSYDPTTGIWTVGDVGVSSTQTLEIVALATSLMEETNLAEVTAADQQDSDSTPGNGDPNEDDIADATVSPATADLSLTKTVDNEMPNVGSEVTFTVTVMNDGPDEATGVAVRDELPTDMTITSFNVTSGSFDENTNVWSIPSIASGASQILTLIASVDTVEDKINIAQVIASDQLDPDSTPGEGGEEEDDYDTVMLSPQLIDLALTKIVNDDNPNIGDLVVFDIDLTNEGPSTATGVTVLDQLPEGLIFQRAFPTIGAYDSNTGIWNVGEIAVGDEPKLRIEAAVDMITSAENFAEVYTADQPDIDSTPGNGDPTEDDMDSAELMTQIADLSLSKVAINDMPGRNDEVIFVVQVMNKGPNNGTDIVVLDPLPSGLRFVSFEATSGEYDPETGKWSFPLIEVGVPEQIRIFAAVTSAEPSTNVAEVYSARQIDPNSTPGNGDPDEDDISFAEVTPRVIDIAVEGDIDNEEPLEGETIQISYTASNTGRDNATGVEFEVRIPDGLALINSQPQSGTYDSNTGRWVVGEINSGAVTRLVLNLLVETRGIRTVPIELMEANEFDIDSTPGNGIESEDDQTEVLVRAPRLLTKRLFTSR